MYGAVDGGLRDEANVARISGKPYK